MFSAKIVEGFRWRSSVARAAVLAAVPLATVSFSVCFTVPAFAQAQQPPAGAATPAPAAPATAAPLADVAPRLAAVLAQPGGLTSGDAGRRASETSVQAKIEHGDVRAAEETKEQVIWNAAPRLTLTGRAQRYSSVDPFIIVDPVTMERSSLTQPNRTYYLNAGLTVPISDYLLRLVQTLRGASTNRDAALLEERAARVTSSANGRVAYYDWVQSELQTIVAEQALSQASAQLARMQALYSVGRAAQADLLQAQAFEADAQLTLSQGQTQQSVAVERLRTTIHAPLDEKLTIGEDVLAEFPAKEEARSVEELYREALAQRLEIKALERSHSALEDSRYIESSHALPTLEAIGNVTYANPNQRIFPLQPQWDATWDVALQLTWTINDVGASSSRASSLDAQISQLDQRKVGVEEQLRLEVVTAYGALNQARQNVVTAQTGERAAGAAYAARVQLQEQGMGTTLELIQAETARINARLNLINAHIALRVARAQLDHAVGRDIPLEPAR